jgi:transcriptional regulator NrdR family protein
MSFRVPVQPSANERRGLVCPKCGCGHFRVIYTRPMRDGRIIRRRECRNCGRRVLTSEKVGVA